MSDYSQELLDQLPTPTGYRILIAIPVEKAEEVSDGGIVLYSTEKKAKQEAHREQTASIRGYVLKVGPDAYNDEKRFPNGPWCKEGDWIMMRSFAGTRFKLGEQEFRLINDDTVEAVIGDPTLIERAY